MKNKYTPTGIHKTTHKSWQNMKKRCYGRYDVSFKHYGGRDITVCDRWLNSFANFLADMGEKPEGLQLDRIDNNGNYKPLNCRWVTPRTNLLNKSDNRQLVLYGRTKHISVWASQLGISVQKISKRLNAKGWTDQQALLTPIKKTDGVVQRLLTFNGKTQGMAEWAREVGLNRHTLQSRLNIYGWSIEKAITHKSRVYKRK